MIALTVISQRDYHDAPIFFRVVDDNNEEYSRFPSELEANAFVEGFKAGQASNAFALEERTEIS